MCLKEKLNQTRFDKRPAVEHPHIRSRHPNIQTSRHQFQIQLSNSNLLPECPLRLTHQHQTHQHQTMSTKQQVRTGNEQISQTQSMVLVRNLLRTGISTISYIRNMFPEEDFGDMFFNKMQMKALKPTENSPANSLITWLERGKYKSQRIRLAVGPDLQSCHCTAIHQLHLHAALQVHSTPFRKDIWRRCRSVSSQV